MFRLRQCSLAIRADRSPEPEEHLTATTVPVEAVVGNLGLYVLSP